jgi:hypothetical protein
MRVIACVLTCALSASPAMAMQSPFYDSAEKITAVLQSEAVADAVRQAAIGQISEIGKDNAGIALWQVRVQECDLTVRLIAHPPKGVGKITYSVELTGPCK